MSSCKDGSCGTHGSSSHGSQGCGCSCHSACKSCGCQSSSCGCQSSCGCKSCCDEKSERLLAVADIAWMEVLKEKIKEHILSTDKKIDELARIVAETNHERWKHKMAKKQSLEHYEESLCQLFDQHCEESQSSSNKGSQGQGNSSSKR